MITPVLRVCGEPDGWYVVNYARRPVSKQLVAGPYRTRLEAEVVARKRSKAAK